MNTSAYDRHLPCLNPNCKSHGRPHPNCRCYGFAEGGEVQHFCSGDRVHKEGCEYFKDGGAVEAPSDLKEVPISEGVSTDAIEAPADLMEVPPESSVTEAPPDLKEATSETDAIEAPADLKEAPSSELDDMDQTFNQLKAFGHGVAVGLGGESVKTIEEKHGLLSRQESENLERDFPVASKVGNAVGRTVPYALAPEAMGAKLLFTSLYEMSHAFSDNNQKAMLGLPGADLKDVVAHSLLDGGIQIGVNVLTHGLFNKVGPWPGAVPWAGKKILNENAVEISKEAMANFAKNNPLNKIVAAGLTVAGAEHPTTAWEMAKHFAPEAGGASTIAAAIKFLGLGPAVAKIIGWPITKLNQLSGAVLLGLWSKSNYLGVGTAIPWAQSVTKGVGATKLVEPLFNSGAQLLVEPVRDLVRDNMKGWLNKGGIDGEIDEDSQAPMGQGHAAGGMISNKPQHAFASAFPQENILLHEARGRVSSYLKTLKPEAHETKLPFDMESSQKEKKRVYESAIGLAVKPISILNHVNNGTLTPEMMRHFKSMYPEVHELLSKKITERIVKAQLSGERPPYAKRQSMSLFLGSDLDSSFTPQSIQAVQALYANQRQQQQSQAPSKTGRGAATLSKLSGSYLTDDQSREQRQQRSKA